MAAVAAPSHPLSAQVVGNDFVKQYYHLLRHSPDLLYKFYGDVGKIGRLEEDGTMSITRTIEAINRKILLYSFHVVRAEFRSVDVQESLNGGLQVLVTGYLTDEDNGIRNFAQIFFHAPVGTRCFILNDILRYLENGKAPAQAAVTHPVSGQVVGNAFVQQYYLIVHRLPALIHRFYQDVSKLGLLEEDGTMTIATTMPAIYEQLFFLSLREFREQIKSVDVQESFEGGLQVLVTGYLTDKDNVIRNFAQSFFLARQDTGYFVLNDILRYLENGNQQEANQALANDVIASVTAEQNPPSSPPAVQDMGYFVLNDIFRCLVTGIQAEANLAVVDDVFALVTPEQKPPPSPPAVQENRISEQSTPKIEEVASPPLNSLPKHQEQVIPPPQKSDGLFPRPRNNEDDGYSIYLNGLPRNATVSLLENVFKKFDPIRNRGIQVRSSRAFTFGIVEFEARSAVQKAIKASPIAVGGHQVIVKKRYLNSRSKRTA